MKRIITGKFSWIVWILLFTTSCNTGNLTDIQRLLSPAALPYLKNSRLIQVSSYNASGLNNDRILVPAGRKVTILDADGPGLISRIWMTVESKDPDFQRRIVIRMFWDNETQPSVEVPLGDFFGNGFNYTPYISQYLGMTNGGYVCYFPMPFESHARIEIANDTRQDITGLFYQVNYQKFEGALELDVAYFHASWNRSVKTDYDSNYRLLEAEGRGHIIGANLSLQSYDQSFSYLGGDEMIFVDGEKTPSIRGTGTEDFFSGGMDFTEHRHAGPYSGLILKNDSLGAIAAYRLFIPDPIPFKKNIIMTIEHGPSNKTVADYSSTVYWYQMEPHKPFGQMLPPGQRIPIRMVKPLDMTEAEKLHFLTANLPVTVEEMADYGADWSGNKQMVIHANESAGFTLILDGLKDHAFDLVLYYTKGPDYGNATIFSGQREIGEIKGYSSFPVPTGKVILEGLQPSAGNLSIRFVVTGKDVASTGFIFGFDGIRMVPVHSTKENQ